MTLRQQFDDILNRILDIASVGAEEEFIETVVEAMKNRDKEKHLEEERKNLAKAAAKKKKLLAKKRSEYKKLNAELEREKKKIEAVLKEKKAVEKVLEEVRRAVMLRKGTDTSSVEILSILESVSFSDIDMTEDS